MPRDLQARGLEARLVAVGDGVLGLWAALEQAFPTTEHQRCRNHRREIHQLATAAD